MQNQTNEQSHDKRIRISVLETVASKEMIAKDEEIVMSISGDWSLFSFIAMIVSQKKILVSNED